MLVVIIFAVISAIIMSLWCSNERRIIQSEEQNNQCVDEPDEFQHDEAMQYAYHNSHS